MWPDSQTKWAELLAPYERIALAISGGSDSIFMLHQMHEFAKKYSKEIIALSVNHNLRKEAKSECNFVQSECRKLGIECELLEWDHNGISSNVHDKARKARYDLMTNYCQENNIPALATAHHMDDRIENFFIRIYRGAGILGLIDKEQITYNNIQIIRPLFDISKNEILKHLNENNIEYVNDSSNEDTKYLRTNIREWLSKMPVGLDGELFKKRVISVKDNLERASDVIESIYEADLKDNVQIFDAGYSKITNLSEKKEVAYMVLAEVMKIVSGQDSQIRLDSIKELYNELSCKNNVKKTLGGCVIEKKSSEIILYREFGKKPPEDVILEDGVLWDGRFLCRVSPPPLRHPGSVAIRDPDNITFGSRIKCGMTGSDDSPSQISYLKESEYAQIRDKLSLNDDLKSNKKIIFTLPVVKYLEKVIAIPHINYYDDAYENLRNQLSFEFKRINNE